MVTAEQIPNREVTFRHRGDRGTVSPRFAAARTVTIERAGHWPYGHRERNLRIAAVHPRDTQRPAVSSTLILGEQDAVLVDAPFTWEQIRKLGDRIGAGRDLLQAIDVGHTDTDNSLVLLVPSIGLVVAGDAIYNGVHQYCVEGGDGGLQEWLRAIDRIEALAPRSVVTGHKNKDVPDDPATPDQTRQHLRDVIRLLDEQPTAGPVWYGALGLLGK
jgi:hypothetical protein